MSRHESILIADDEQEIRSLLSALFSSEFDKLDVACDGQEACTKLEAKQYDLVLTDIIMPGIDGVGVLKLAKELYPDIVVIMLTGQATLDSAIESVNLGADEFILKPFDVRRLLNVAKSHLERQNLARQNRELQNQIKRDRDQLKKNLVELSILYNFSRNLSYNFDVFEVYTTILDSLSEAVSNDFCSIYSLKRNRLTVRASVALHDCVLGQLKMSIAEFLRTNGMDAVAVDNIEVDLHEPDTGEKCRGPVQTTVNFALKIMGKIIGVLNVNRISSNSFSEDDIRFLTKIAEQSSLIFTQLRGVVDSQTHKLQRLIEEMPDGVVMHDLRDDSILINPAAERMFSDAGLARYDRENLETLFNFSFEDFYKHPEHTRKREPFIREIVIPMNDNDAYIVDAHVACLSGSDAMPQELLMLLRNVTKERELDRLKSEFIANVSHELRTPVAVLKEFTAIIRDGIAGETTAAQQEYLQIMANNIERLLRLIDNILYMSRMEAGILKLRKETFDITNVIDGVVQTVRVSFAEKGITLKSDIQADMPAVYSDPDAVTQILLNCLDNARKFSPENSEVRLKAFVRGNVLHLEIRDSGKGIPNKHLDKIFTRFYRIEDKNGARLEGSGLGLSIVKEFIDLNSGKITVDSEVNKGSTFHMEIPLTENEALSEVQS